MTMQKLLRMGLVGLALCMPGCSREIRIPEPKDETFTNGPVAIIDYTYDSRLGRDLYMKDVDNDGQVDFIHHSSYAFCVAPGYEQEIFFTDAYTLVMTPEIREAANNEMKAERELTKLLAKEAYRQYQIRNGGQR